MSDNKTPNMPGDPDQVTDNAKAHGDRYVSADKDGSLPGSGEKLERPKRQPRRQDAQSKDRDTERDTRDTNAHAEEVRKKAEKQAKERDSEDTGARLTPAQYEDDGQDSIPAQMRES